MNNDTSSADGQYREIIELDRLFHEPARMVMGAILYIADGADFIFMLRQTGLTRGNLSSHMSKLEEAGYIEVIKDFVDRKPRTMMHMTRKGRKAFEVYRDQLKRTVDNLHEG